MIKFYPHKPGYFDDHGDVIELEHISDIQLYIDVSPYVCLYKIPYPSVYRPYEYKLVTLGHDDLLVIGYIEDGRDLELKEWCNDD